MTSLASSTGTTCSAAGSSSSTPKRASSSDSTAGGSSGPGLAARTATEPEPVGAASSRAPCSSPSCTSSLASCSSGFRSTCARLAGRWTRSVAPEATPLVQAEPLAGCVPFVAAKNHRSAAQRPKLPGPAAATTTGPSPSSPLTSVSCTGHDSVAIWARPTARVHRQDPVTRRPPETSRSAATRSTSTAKAYSMRKIRKGQTRRPPSGGAGITSRRLWQRSSFFCAPPGGRFRRPEGENSWLGLREPATCAEESSPRGAAPPSPAAVWRPSPATALACGGGVAQPG
mmetsp:Transcript_55877/g.164100  ORF Transcript_55877/g.164100 Transcript_55877/m.164100 type:complete len:286 (+) Transcript_55877:1301-2158(+)